MCIVYVSLYYGGGLKGGVVFDSLVVGENNSECLPADILTSQEVEEVRRQLCRLPQINEGQVGDYKWRASNKPLPSMRQAGSSPRGMANSRWGQ
jgi:hypothetical protein